jgi:hypothetical protein
MNTPSTRRSALRFSAAALVAGVTLPASAGVATTVHPEAELIATCQRFAEAEFESWYRFVVESDEEDDAEWDAQCINVMKWITATPATTVEGCRAKALALTAWHRDFYDDQEDDRDTHTTFLAALLRDMVAPARNAIVARCSAKYGPLPASYTADGIWLGYTAEEKAVAAAHIAARLAEREAEQAAAIAEIERKTRIATMTKEELEASLPGVRDLRDFADHHYKRVLARIAELSA